MSLLTVALTTYNRPEFLAESIESVLGQTFSNFALLILDNASDPRTEEVVASYRDSRIKYIRHPSNIGFLANANFAIDICESKYLLWTHDDDRMKPSLLEREVRILESDDDVNLVCCDKDLIDAAGELIAEHVTSNECGFSADFRDGQFRYIDNYMASKNYITCPTTMLRMAVVKQHNVRYRDVGPAIDTYFYVELNQRPGDFYYLNESLFEYRVHDVRTSALLTTFVMPLRKPLCELLSGGDAGILRADTWLRFSLPRLVSEIKERINIDQFSWLDWLEFEDRYGKVPFFVRLNVLVEWLFHAGRKLVHWRKFAG